jgi:cell division protein ZapA (FtsZ GTPase activity inhibitor)
MTGGEDGVDQTSRLILKGLLAEKREKLRELMIRIDRLVKDINHYTFRFDEEDIRSIKDDHLLQAAHELQEALRQARSLEKEVREADGVG